MIFSFCLLRGYVFCSIKNFSINHLFLLLANNKIAIQRARTKIMGIKDRPIQYLKSTERRLARISGHLSAPWLNLGISSLTFSYWDADKTDDPFCLYLKFSDDLWLIKGNSKTPTCKWVEYFFLNRWRNGKKRGGWGRGLTLTRNSMKTIRTKHWNVFCLIAESRKNNVVMLL